MKSMTGYGKGTASLSSQEVTVELRAVNNRYLEVNTRLPKNFLACDDLIRSLISKHLKRGSVDVFFNYASIDGGRGVSADIPLIKQYKTLAAAIERETGVTDDLSFSALMRGQELIIPEHISEDTETILELTGKATVAALEALEKMRETEGNAIYIDLIRLITKLEDIALLVKTRAPQIVTEYKEKITTRIKEILGETIIDETKLLNEVAFFADKTDINEELQRLDSHIAQFKMTADSFDASGRKLDFICQEIGREVNTLGSKANDISLTSYVLEMKDTLEKIKEQIRNVE